MKLNEKFIKTWERDKLEKPTMVCFRCPAVKTVRNSREVVNRTIETEKQKKKKKRRRLELGCVENSCRILEQNFPTPFGTIWPGRVHYSTRPNPFSFFFSLAPFTIAPGTI